MQTVNIALDTGGIISILIGTVLPIVVGYVTAASLNSGLKAAILAGFAGLSGVLSQWLTAINNNQHFAWQAAVISAFLTYLVAEASYFKIWKPSGVSDVVQAAGPISDAATYAAKHDGETGAAIADAITEAATPN